MEQIPHEASDKTKAWEVKAQADLDANDEIFGEYPPVKDIQDQMWAQAREHLSYEEALVFMRDFFPIYEHEVD